MPATGFVNLGTPPLQSAEPPFPAYEDKIIKIIEQAICEAWQLLKINANIDLWQAKETTITKELVNSIVMVMNNGSVDGFWPELFNQPARDASVEDYTGNFIEKKPDLTIKLSKPLPLSPNKGLFFECKPLGSISNYFGKNGLERFCDCRYAWAMPHAGMIGYVQRQTSSMTAKEAIEKKVKTGELILNKDYADPMATYHPIWVTVHARNFVLTNGKKPGPIVIRHLWLSP